MKPTEIDSVWLRDAFGESVLFVYRPGFGARIERQAQELDILAGGHLGHALSPRMLTAMLAQLPEVSVDTVHGENCSCAWCTRAGMRDVLRFYDPVSLVSRQPTTPEGQAAVQECVDKIRAMTGPGMKITTATGRLSGDELAQGPRSLDEYATVVAVDYSSLEMIIPVEESRRRNRELMDRIFGSLPKSRFTDR
jgi:hypothetical protein